MTLPATGYDTATLSNPSSALTDFTLMVDLSRMSTDWWSAVDTSDATRGRAAKDDGTELPAAWLEFDDATQTGWLAVQWAGSLASTGTQTLRIYPPSSANTSVAASDPYGSDNAFDDATQGYWPDGGGTDWTANGNDAATASGLESATTGQVGDATDYATSNNEASHASGAALQITDALTIDTWFRTDGSFHNQAMIGKASSYSLWLRSTDVAWRTYDTSANLDQIDSADITTGAWHHAVAVFDGNSIELYMNGVLDNTTGLGTTKTLGGSTNDTLLAGGPQGGTNTDGGYSFGSLDNTSISDTARSADWVAEQYSQTSDQATFWGTWAWTAPASATVLETDFSEYTAGTFPSDWTKIWDSGEANQWGIASVAGTTGGQVLRSPVSVEDAASWNAVDAEAGRANVDIEILFRVQSSNLRPGIIGRAGGSWGARTGYLLVFNPSAGKLQLHDASGNVFSGTPIASANKSLNTNTWYHMRFRLEDDALQGKMWQDGSAEPGWDIDTTDSTYTAAGSAGVWCDNDAANFDVDTFSAEILSAANTAAIDDGGVTSGGSMSGNVELAAALASLGGVSSSAMAGDVTAAGGIAETGVTSAGSIVGALGGQRSASIADAGVLSSGSVLVALGVVGSIAELGVVSSGLMRGGTGVTIAGSIADSGVTSTGAMVAAAAVSGVIAGGGVSSTGAIVGQVIIPSPSFALYDQAAGRVMAYIDPDARTFDLSTLGLGEGEWTLGLSRINAYGCESTHTTVAVSIDAGGNPTVNLLPATDLRTWPTDGGNIAVSWIARDLDGQYQRAAAYEIAEAPGSNGPVTVLATVTAGKRGAFELEVGPFSHGQTVRLMVRASDGDASGGGGRGEWVAAPPAVADAAAPSVPALEPDALTNDC